MGRDLPARPLHAGCAALKFSQEKTALHHGINIGKTK